MKKLIDKIMKDIIKKSFELGLTCSLDFPNIKTILEKHLLTKEEEHQTISTKEYNDCLMSDGMIGYVQMKKLLQDKGLWID